MWCTQHVLERPCVGGGPPATRFTVRAATPPWAAQTTSWLSRTSPLTKRAPPSWRGSRRPASEPAAAAREALRAARRGYRSLKRLARRKVTRFVLGWRVSTQLGNELRGGAKVVDARDALARVERPGVEQVVRSSDRRGRAEERAVRALQPREPALLLERDAGEDRRERSVEGAHPGGAAPVAAEPALGGLVPDHAVRCARPARAEQLGEHRVARLDEALLVRLERAALGRHQEARAEHGGVGAGLEGAGYVGRVGHAAGDEHGGLGTERGARPLAQL